MPSSARAPLIEKGEAAGTHPEKKAELFTLASTHLLALLNQGKSEKNRATL
jgi:hypothetical protein